MTNYDTVLQMHALAKKNIEKFSENGFMEGIDKQFVFLKDLEQWIQCCGDFASYELVIEANGECLRSLILCMQGYYKDAFIGLRQFMEHMLFAIDLSTNDFKYRKWKRGKEDMVWSKIVDKDQGIFSVEFLKTYAADVDEERSIEFHTIAKNIYRECSEYVHGNYEKLENLSYGLKYSEESIETYLNMCDSIRYLICAELFIRYRDIFDDNTVLTRLESILIDNLGSMHEVQNLFND